ncbi:Fic family protein [Aliifodinibius sp. S!AR15-10]|uniref:Fic family protein n=1 Tax=Aliifodinibius sp. S!AR15-10 TaxID=2950437 RepID=UPI002857FF71|nr:Fic family protein [Aliifodinibius sp. S!AR15-10]MDR8392087.1 Fic family protein [Aliifodinibius sp. S!AR15-10]
MGVSSELAQLRELIQVFPDKYSLKEVEKANAAARTKYELLDNDLIPYITESLKSGKFELNTSNCFKLCEVFHGFIFQDIISNNGQFRDPHDPNDGHVFFGGQKRGELQPKFTGTQPSNIKRDLKKAFKFLHEDTPVDPVENALKFYQRFVKTHPFYDGNGRVARLFVNIYLLRFGLYIDWRNLQKQSSFLKKLNLVHKTQIPKHFEWWKNKCEKFIRQISDEDQE